MKKLVGVLGLTAILSACGGAVSCYKMPEYEFNGTLDGEKMHFHEAPLLEDCTLDVERQDVSLRFFDVGCKKELWTYSVNGASYSAFRENDKPVMDEAQKAYLAYLDKILAERQRVGLAPLRE